MTGPLAQQFAQVRKNLDLITDEGHCTCGRVYTCDWCLEQEALDALSAIERHVQDMERLSVENAAYSALHSAVERADAHGNLADLWDVEDALTACNAKLAALPAREKEEETNG